MARRYSKRVVYKKDNKRASAYDIYSRDFDKMVKNAKDKYGIIISKKKYSEREFILQYDSVKETQRNEIGRTTNITKTVLNEQLKSSKRRSIESFIKTTGQKLSRKERAQITFDTEEGQEILQSMAQDMIGDYQPVNTMDTEEASGFWNYISDKYHTLRDSGESVSNAATLISQTFFGSP